MKWLFLSLAILLTACANVLLKYAAGINHSNATTAVGFLKKTALNPYLISGGVCLAAAMVFYTLSLRFLQLSVAYPIMTCSVVVMVAFLSQHLFQEHMTAWKLLGTGLVISGVVEGHYAAFYEKAGPLYVLELLNYVLFPALGVHAIFQCRKTANPFKKRQLDYMLAAAAIGF